MALVTLKSKLSNITRSSTTPKKSTTTTKAVDYFTNTDAKGFTVRHAKNDTKFVIEGFSQNPIFNEKNRYQEPVNREDSKLKIAWDNIKDDYYARGRSTTDSLGLRKGKFGNTQPYVIRDVGQRWNLSNSPVVGNNVELIRGGASTYASRVLADIGRTTDFLTKSGQGATYLLKQQFLQTFNVGGDLGERANIYNPLSPMINAQGFIKTPRHIDIPFSDSIRKKLKDLLPSFNGFNLSKLAAPANQARYKDIDLSLGGLLGLSSNEVPDIKTSKGDKLNFYQKIVKGIDQKDGDKVNLIPYGKRFDEFGEIDESDGGNIARYFNETEDTLDFIPFRFKDVNSGNYIVFTPEYSPERYIGRPDSVYVYQGTQREISFTFDIYPKSKEELEVLWEKINYLSGLTYPALDDINGGGQAMIAPFCELTIGDMYNDTPGYISGLTHTVQDNGTWEIEPDLRLPKYIQTAVTFVYVGKRLPTNQSKHYELPWIRDNRYKKQSAEKDPY